MRQHAPPANEVAPVSPTGKGPRRTQSAALASLPGTPFSPGSPTTQNKYQLAAQLHQHVACNTSAFKTGLSLESSRATTIIRVPPRRSRQGPCSPEAQAQEAGSPGLQTCSFGSLWPCGGKRGSHSSRSGSSRRFRNLVALCILQAWHVNKEKDNPFPGMEEAGVREKLC